MCNKMLGVSRSGYYIGKSGSLNDVGNEDNPLNIHTIFKESFGLWCSKNLKWSC